MNLYNAYIIYYTIVDIILYGFITIRNVFAEIQYVHLTLSKDSDAVSLLNRYSTLFGS